MATPVDAAGAASSVFTLQQAATQRSAEAQRSTEANATAQNQTQQPEADTDVAQTQRVPNTSNVGNNVDTTA